MSERPQWGKGTNFSAYFHLESADGVLATRSVECADCLLIYSTNIILHILSVELGES